MAGDLASLAKRQGELILKPMEGIIGSADMDTELLDSFRLTTATVANGPITLTSLTQYEQLGWVSKSDGITFSSDTEQEDVESFGSPEPTRTDIIRDVTSSQFVCQETNKAVLEHYHNVDLSAVEPDEFSGEVQFDNPSSPNTTYRRMIFLSQDGRPGNEIWIAKLMPRASVTAKADQQHGGGTELNYGMTVTATVDDELGFSVRHIFAGPGWRKNLAKMGFTP